MQSITHLFDFDADPNVLVLIAHDMAPKDSLTFFPNGTVNDWKSKGCKEVSSILLSRPKFVSLMSHFFKAMHW